MQERNRNIITSTDEVDQCTDSATQRVEDRKNNPLGAHSRIQHFIQGNASGALCISNQDCFVKIGTPANYFSVHVSTITLQNRTKNLGQNLSHGSKLLHVIGHDESIGSCRDGMVMLHQCSCFACGPQVFQPPRTNCP